MSTSSDPSRVVGTIRIREYGAPGISFSSGGLHERPDTADVNTACPHPSKFRWQGIQRKNTSLSAVCQEIVIAVGSPEALSSKVVTMALARGFLRLKLVPGLEHALRVTRCHSKVGRISINGARNCGECQARIQETGL